MNDFDLAYNELKDIMNIYYDHMYSLTKDEDYLISKVLIDKGNILARVNELTSRIAVLKATMEGLNEIHRTDE